MGATRGYSIGRNLPHEGGGFKTLKKGLPIFSDSRLRFRIDEVETPDNERIERKVVEYHPSSAIVAVKPSEGVLLIRHFRYPVGKYIWDIPGGMRKPGESGEQCAVRELGEETGYEVSHVSHLLTFFPEPAFTDQVLSLYTGTIVEGGYSKDLRIAEEEIPEARIFGFDKIRSMINDGDIASSWSIIGLLLALEQHG